MNGIELTPEDDFVEIGGPLPRIRSARFAGEMKVSVEWEGGKVEIVDLRPAIMSHRHFVALRDNPELFASFRVRERGDALMWPDGQELSAVWIEELAPVTMRNDEFRQAMDDLRLSLDGMAARLGIARRVVADYRKDRAIPPSIALATRYLLEHQRRAS
ncbi:DUF2442 domain-containing protein [Devosia sp. RR2S18]|jgi:hypothetical protein|uniref:DUF2442 domain-containing protein n=1 Tax=Devosia rhizosphaerae TaxID=3049774 RepID=UPI00254112F7|nr:DUF2442 domain-containing protein [Devosia sp. RR2S18]WIJ23653.1 DUF2442 domain-containing protein [Devosia sp. RR2S18]